MEEEKRWRRKEMEDHILWQTQITTDQSPAIATTEDVIHKDQLSARWHQLEEQKCTGQSVIQSMHPSRSNDLSITGEENTLKILQILLTKKRVQID